MNSKVKLRLKRLLSASLSAAMLLSYSMPSYAGQVTSTSAADSWDSLKVALEGAELKAGAEQEATHVANGKKYTSEATAGYFTAELENGTYYLIGVEAEVDGETISNGGSYYKVYDSETAVLEEDSVGNPATGHTWTLADSASLVPSQEPNTTYTLDLVCSDAAKDTDSNAATAKATFESVDTANLQESYNSTSIDEISEGTSDSNYSSVELKAQDGALAAQKYGKPVTYDVMINSSDVGDVTLTSTKATVGWTSSETVQPKDAVPATHTTAGNSAYYTVAGNDSKTHYLVTYNPESSDGNNVFVDSNGTAYTEVTEATDESYFAIPATGHIWSVAESAEVEVGNAEALNSTLALVCATESSKGATANFEKIDTAALKQEYTSTSVDVITEGEKSATNYDSVKLVASKVGESEVPQEWVAPEKDVVVTYTVKSGEGYNNEIGTVTLISTKPAAITSNVSWAKADDANVTPVPAKDVTHTEDGNIAYSTVEGDDNATHYLIAYDAEKATDNNVFVDNGNNYIEVSQSDVTLSATGHKWTVSGAEESDYWNDGAKELKLTCSNEANIDGETAATTTVDFASKIDTAELAKTYTITNIPNSDSTVGDAVTLTATKIGDNAIIPESWEAPDKDVVVTYSITIGTSVVEGKEITLTSTKVTNNTITLDKSVEDLPEVTSAVFVDDKPISCYDSVYTVKSGSNVTIIVNVPDGYYATVAAGDVKVTPTEPFTYTIEGIDADYTISVAQYKTYELSAAWESTELGTVSVTLTDTAETDPAESTTLDLTVKQAATENTTTTWNTVTLTDGSVLSATTEDDNTITVQRTGTCLTTESTTFKRHNFTDKVAAVAATCLVKGHLAYYTCTNSGCEAKAQKLNGTAMSEEDFNTKLVKPALGHSVGAKVPEVPAKCEEDGTEAYYQCSACKLKFASKVQADVDEVLKDVDPKVQTMNSLSDEDLIIPKTLHKYTGEAVCKIGESNLDDVPDAWFTENLVKGELEPSSQEENVYKYTVKADADPITTTYTCANCGEKVVLSTADGGSNLPDAYTGSIIAIYGRVVSDYQKHQSNGEVVYSINSDLKYNGKVASLSKARTVITESGEHNYSTIDWGDWTEGQKVTAQTTDGRDYTYSNYTIDATLSCSCGDVIAAEDITITPEITAPTCDTDGKVVWTASCTVNGETETAETKEEIIPKLGHLMKDVEYTAPTCETAGENFHYKCESCQKVGEDPDGVDAAENKGQFNVEPLGHKLTNVSFVMSGSFAEPVVTATFSCIRSGCDKKIVLTSNETNAEGSVELSAPKTDLAATCHSTGIASYTATAHVDYDVDGTIDTITNEDCNTELTLTIPVDENAHDYQELYFVPAVDEESTAKWMKKSEPAAGGTYDSANDTEFTPAKDGSDGKWWTDDAMAAGNNVTAANCQNLAVYKKVCSVCGTQSDETFEAGKLTEHVYEKVEAVPTTCYKEGCQEYYTCSYEADKNIYQMNEDGTYTVTTLEALAIPKVAHNYSATCTTHKDGNGKYYARVTLSCSTCAHIDADADGDGATDASGPESTIILYKAIDEGANLSENTGVPEGAEFIITCTADEDKASGNCENGGYTIPYNASVVYKYGEDPAKVEAEAEDTRFVFDSTKTPGSMSSSITRYGHILDASSIIWGDWFNDQDPNTQPLINLQSKKCARCKNDVDNVDTRIVISRDPETEYCKGTFEGEEYEVTYTASCIRYDNNEVISTTSMKRNEPVKEDTYAATICVWPEAYNGTGENGELTYADYVALVTGENAVTELPKVTLYRQCTIGKEWQKQEVTPTLKRVVPDGQDIKIPFNNVFITCQRSDTLRLSVTPADDGWQSTEAPENASEIPAYADKTLVKKVGNHEWQMDDEGNYEGVELAESTCETYGHKSYIPCTKCNDYVLEADLDIDDEWYPVSEEPVLLEDLTDKEYAPHNIVLYPGKDPTCTEPGYLAHYECTVCGKWFTSTTGEEEIKDHTASTIPATGHKYDKEHVEFTLGEVNGLNTEVTAAFTCINENCGSEQHVEEVAADVTNYKVTIVGGTRVATISAEAEVESGNGENAETITASTDLTYEMEAINYADELAKAQDSLSTTAVADEETYRLYFRGSRAIPDTLTVKEQGLLLITASDYQATDVLADMSLTKAEDGSYVPVGTSVKKKAGASKANNGIYEYYLGVGNNSESAKWDRLLYARTYVVVQYEDAEGSHEEVLYHNNSYNVNSYRRLVDPLSKSIKTGIFLKDDHETTRRVYFAETRNLGTGYTVKEHGLLVITSATYDSANVETDLTLEGADSNTVVKKKTGEGTGNNGTYEYYVGVGSTGTNWNRVLYARAFITVEHVEDGRTVTETFYGDVVSGSYNGLVDDLGTN